MLYYNFYSEFTMAEIEHFVDPEDKDHPHFDDVKDVVITLLSKDVQLSGKTETREVSIGEAVEKVNQADGKMIFFGHND